MIVTHSTQTLNAIRLVNVNIESYSKSTEKVSSGYKVNSGADYPAGLSVSETMRRQIRGLERGLQNTKDGINFCQVADGALNEVTDMVQRISALSVQAANGTNIKTDRHYIQAEIDQILSEIDRICDTTTFNEIPVFRGFNTVSGTPSQIPDGAVIEGDIPFTDFTISDVSLGSNPFANVSNGDSLALQAIVNNPSSSAHNKQYNLIFGNGSTSHSSFRLTYKNDIGEDVQVIQSMRELGNNLSVDDIPHGTTQDSQGRTQWWRSFEYSNDDDIRLTITQRITADIPEDPAQEKKYIISYDIDNNSSGNKDVALDFLFHADTAYNNRDELEGYFINGADGNGKRLDKFCMYTDGGAWAGTLTNNETDNITNGLPGSFSIIDMDHALAFSEKVSFVPGYEPNAMTVGYYYNIHDWANYGANLGNIDLGSNAIRRDLGFSFFWNNQISAGGTSHMAFNYGIVASESDPNLKNIPLVKDENVVFKPSGEKTTRDIWIQSGCDKGSGIWLEIDDMNTAILGIDKLDVTTIKGADDSIVRTKAALQSILDSRSKIGAQQNRLEHTLANEGSIVEFAESSESRIRDTDISSEMIRFSNLNILLKMGQEMIAESNKNIEKVLNLI